MDWERALPRFAACLTPTGFLAVVEEVARPAPWSTDISPILARYSMNRDFQPYDMLTVVQELEARGLFRRDGSVEIPAVAFRQPVGDWIEALHARNGFSRDRMDPATAAACDRELASVLLRHCPTGVVEQWIGARVIWGKPMGRSEA
jgi:hypothetical protein